MQILLLGAGAVTSRLNLLLAEHGHSVAAQLAAFTTEHLDLFDFQGVVVVSPELPVSVDICSGQAINGFIYRQYAEVLPIINYSRFVC